LISARFHDYALLDLLRWLEDRELLSPVTPVTPKALRVQATPHSQ
jgi:hypothetical protein